MWYWVIRLEFICSILGFLIDEGESLVGALFFDKATLLVQLVVVGAMQI